MLNREKVIFTSAEDMLEEIQCGRDFYNLETKEYVFVYNDCGSICVYSIDEYEAKELMKCSEESGEYWGAYLGWGGGIYDDPSHECYTDDMMNNMDFCNATYFLDGWIDVTPPEIDN